MTPIAGPNHEDVDFIPRSFALVLSARSRPATPLVVAWGMTLPDGSVITVGWSEGSTNTLSICGSPARAAWLYGATLAWVDERGGQRR
ncbi:hypothetical protein EV385_3247 [Krasilnikovia cinnamomea]|uniref:Uncharacterized protein n=1 Tax=Krasilnikovia cinnamomea TaxID=349313 RepID=A0A4Q7ZKG5_9ACTN|nr:hypothetical protein [Krasilnikovia cinnamomea]RZU51420.1 hypothetical protein EV385_3247 [Krasilnikovia cinnamomea]